MAIRLIEAIYFAIIPRSVLISVLTIRSKMPRGYSKIDLNSSLQMSRTNILNATMNTIVTFQTSF